MRGRWVSRRARLEHHGFDRFAAGQRGAGGFFRQPQAVLARQQGRDRRRFVGRTAEFAGVQQRPDQQAGGIGIRLHPGFGQG